MLVVGAAIIYARCPSTVHDPELYAEDGAYWLTNAYLNGPLHPLLSPHTGYLQTFPRLVADLGLLMPLTWLPALYVAFAVLVQALPAAVIASRRFSRVVPSFPVRVLLGVAYLLIPNSQEVNANLTNAQWHLALVAFLVLVAADAGLAWRIFDVVFVLLSALTGPFAIALVPIGLVFYLCRRRPWTRVLLALLAACAVVQVISLCLSTRGKLAGLGVSAKTFVQIGGGQIVGGTVSGPAGFSTGQFPVPNVALCALLLAGAMVVCALALWRGPIELKLFNVFVLLVLGSSLATPVVTATQPQWQALATDTGCRYWFFPALALVADLFWMAGQLRRWHGVVGALGLAGLVCVASFGIPNSFSYLPIHPRPNWTKQVQAFDRLRPGTPYKFTEIPTGWTFVLVRK